MAKVKIQGHASGTGILTVTAPNTSTDRTITLPDGDVTLGAATPSITDNGNANAITIDSSENVGIGVTPAMASASYNGLHIGATYPTMKLSSTSSGHAAADGFHLRIDSTPRVEYWNYENTDQVFANNNAEKLRLLAAGGITFNGDTATANALTDYEEGTWTPTLNNTGGTPSYTWQKGHYVKVGAWVWLTANVKFTVTPSGATQQAVGGMPFANRNGAGQYTAAMFTPKQGFNYDGDGLTADIYDGSTIAYLEEYDAGTGGNGGSLLANEIGTTVEFRFSTFYTTT